MLPPSNIPYNYGTHKDQFTEVEQSQHQIHFVGMVNITTRMNPHQSKGKGPQPSLERSRVDINMTNHIPLPPLPIQQSDQEKLQKDLEQQLRLIPLKFSLWYLIQYSQQHREAFHQILCTIELDASYPKTFINFTGNVQHNVEPFIPFFHHAIRNVLSHKFKDPPLHIIAQVDGKSFKRVLINGGSIISVVSSVPLGKLNFPLSHLKALTLIL